MDMSREAKILFHNTDENIREYVANQTGDYVTIFHHNELHVIVKEIKAKEQTYEKVRMIAGNIARDLKRKKIIKALVDDKEFTNAFSQLEEDRKSTRLNSSHVSISYAVFCLKK